MQVTEHILKGQVHCPMCTHTVGAEVDMNGRRAKTVAGQKCSRCHSSLDAAVVMDVLPRAA